MASPVMTPRPQRSMAGAIVLIILGLLFLMGTMGFLNWHSLGLYFARFWPALLILWGIIKLIEHEQAKRAGLPSRGIGVGGIFLVLFIIVAGLIATQAARVNWKNVGDHIQLGDDQDFEDIFGRASFNYSDELTQEFPAGASLRIDDERGSITVNPSDDKMLKVSIRKKIRAEKQEDADKYNSQTKPQIEVNGRIVTLNANTQGAGDKGVGTDMDVYVPRNTELQITAKRGNVSLTGMVGNAEINGQRGEVNISDQSGNVTLDLERSSARLEHIKGDVTIQGKANEVAVEDVDGAVRLSGEFMESVRLVRVSKVVSFRSSRTDMEFTRLDGRLDLDSGDLRADSLNGPMRLVTRSKDISLDGLSGDLRLENSNGTVEVGLYKPGNVQIENHKGDVQVTIPPNTGIKIDARARGGEINSDFSELQVNNSEHQASASGGIGNSAARMVINSDNGTIEIRKGTVAVATPTPPPPPSKPGKPTKALPAPKAPPMESEN